MIPTPTLGRDYGGNLAPKLEAMVQAVDVSRAQTQYLLSMALNNVRSPRAASQATGLKQLAAVAKAAKREDDAAISAWKEWRRVIEAHR